jgi:hypothetical protein
VSAAATAPSADRDAARVSRHACRWRSQRRPRRQTRRARRRPHPSGSRPDRRGRTRGARKPRPDSDQDEAA